MITPPRGQGGGEPTLDPTHVWFVRPVAGNGGERPTLRVARDTPCFCLYATRRTMSTTIKTRHEQRLELLAAILNELLSMPEHAYRTLAEWSLSVGILTLILQGEVAGTVGVMGVTILMSVDFARLYSIYKRVELGDADALKETE